MRAHLESVFPKGLLFSARRSNSAGESAAGADADVARNVTRLVDAAKADLVSPPDNYGQVGGA